MKGLKHLPEWGLPVLSENIPTQLKNTHRWVVWKALENDAGRVLKMPYTIDGVIAQTNNPQHRFSFDDAHADYVCEDYNGLGFVLTGMKTKLTVLDLDKCMDDEGKPLEWAQRIIDAANSYTELSPSGNGIRVFLTGDAGEFTRAKLGVEVYTSQSGRYLTVTGNILGEHADSINPLSEQLMEVLAEYRPEEKGSEPGQGPVMDLSDKELHEILREVPCEKYEHYDEWLALGMAIHHQWSGDPDAMELWDELSEKTASHDREELESKWDSFSLGGGKQVTIRSWLPMHEATLHADQDWPDLGDEASGEGAVPVEGREEPGDAREGGSEGAEVGSRSDDREAGEESGDDGVDLDAADYAALGLQDGDTAVDMAIPEEILEDWLAKREVSGWAGQPGAMKTMSLLDLAVTMTKEHEGYGEWLGQLVKPGVVLWFAYEGVGAIHKRLRAYRTKEPVPARLVIVTPKYDLNAKEWRDYAVEIIQAVTKRHGQRPQLIVVDTLAAACPGLKEKDEDQMGIIARRLRKTAEGVRAHVAYIHHSTKDGSSDLRGSGLLGGDADTIIKMENRGGAVQGVDIEVRKQRNLGSVGQTRQGTLEIVKTGLETSFGRDETAPMLQYLEKTEVGGSPEVMDFRDRLDQAILEAGEDMILKGKWLQIREAWLETWYPNLHRDTTARRLREAWAEVKSEYVWEPDAKTKQVAFVRRINKGQSQGFDADSENWGGF